jgi:hypothetical protein
MPDPYSRDNFGVYKTRNRDPEPKKEWKYERESICIRWRADRFSEKLE